MTVNRRSALLAALALPSGCTIQPLAPLPRSAIPAPREPGSLRAPVVGQRWTYRKLNLFNSSLLDVVQETVASLAPTIDVHRQSDSGAALPDERHAVWGQLLRDPAWDYAMNFETPVPLWPASLTVGVKTMVNTRYRVDGGSIPFWVQVYTAVPGWERVTVGAGTFDTLRIERLIRLDHPDPTRSATVRQDKIWFLPEAGRWVARETAGEYYQISGDNAWTYSLEDHFRWELAAWK
jgi:hypothetical protein